MTEMIENPVLAWGLKRRKEIKALEDTLMEEKRSVNAVIMLTMVDLGIKAYIGIGGDSLICKDGGISKNLNKDKMVKAFLEAGVAADAVHACITKATEEKPRAGSIDFRERKEEGGPQEENHVAPAENM